MDASLESEKYVCWQCEKSLPVKKKRPRFEAAPQGHVVELQMGHVAELQMGHAPALAMMGHAPAAKSSEDADAVQLLNMLRSSASPSNYDHNDTVGHDTAPVRPHSDTALAPRDIKPVEAIRSSDMLNGSIRLQFDLGFGHSFSLPIPRKKQLMELSALVEQALHQSGPGQMLLVTRLTDANGVQVPATVEEGGHFFVGHSFNEKDVVSVLCQTKT